MKILKLQSLLLNCFGFFLCIGVSVAVEELLQLCEELEQTSWSSWRLPYEYELSFHCKDICINSGTLALNGPR